MSRKAAGDLLVVTETEAASVFPSSREESLWGLLVDGSRTAFAIDGSVYGKTVRLRGSGVIQGPVFGSEGVTLETVRDSRLVLRGGIMSPRAITTELDTPINVFKSPATSVDGIRIVVRGDVTSASRVELQNALVFGSVQAPEIVLQNCIVLGAVIADEHPGYVHATCSTLGLYRAHRIVFEGPTTFVVAGGSSLEKPEFIDHAVPGKPRLPTGMRLLGLCRLGSVGCGDWDEPVTTPLPSPLWDEAPDFGARMPGFTCAYWMLSACPFQKGIAVVPSDFVQMQIEVMAHKELGLVAARQPARGTREQSLRWVLQVQARAMNLAPLRDAEGRYHDVVHRIFAEDHLGDDGIALRDQEAWKELSEYERRIFGLALREQADGA